MKYFLFYFLFLVICTSFANATLNLNQGKLNFNMFVGGEVCKNTILSSEDYEGIIKVRDVWAENINEGSNLNKYTFAASDHGITISYDSIIEDFDEEVKSEICITANNLGEYKGALVFTPETDSNVVIEVGTWLFVSVVERSQEYNPNSGSSSKTDTKTEEIVEEIEVNQEEIEEVMLVNEEVEETIDQQINENTEENSENKNNPIALGVGVVVLIILFLIILLIKRRKKK